ncbi:MAG TPA: TRAP transporter large permease [Magnetospirillaceae bacterium]|nr:TRAP transporter large permease [Magnetospirillaceae bacterium]
MILILFGMLFTMVGLGFSIWFSMCLSGIAYILIRGDVSLRLVVSQMVGGVSSDILVAIPFFILAGNLMSTTGITRRLTDFADFFVGKYRAGLAYVSIVVSLFMAGISGSAISDASSTSAVLHPIMKQRGYDDAFAAAINSSSAIVGPIIPPSIPMMIIGIISGISIGRMFLGGFIPGFMIAGVLWILVTVQANRRKYNRVVVERTWKRFFALLKDTFLALLAPLIVLSGVVFGFVTLVEVAALAILYILAISVLVYKTLTFKVFFQTMKETAVFCTSIMIIFAVVGLYQYIVASEQLGQQLYALVQSWNLSRNAFLLFTLVFLLLMGCVLDAVPVMLIFFPVLLPVATGLGIDPVHYGVITVLNLMIGLLTPPVGALLFVQTKIAKISINVLVRELVPHIAVLVFVLVLATYFPQLVLWLPGLVF